MKSTEGLSHNALLAKFVDLSQKQGVTNMDTDSASPTQVTPSFAIYIQSISDSEMKAVSIPTSGASSSRKQSPFSVQSWAQEMEIEDGAVDIGVIVYQRRNKGSSPESGKPVEFSVDEDTKRENVETGIGTDSLGEKHIGKFGKSKLQSDRLRRCVQKCKW